MRSPNPRPERDMDPRIREDDDSKSPSFLLFSVIPAQAGIHPRARPALKLRAFHQKAHAPHTLPFISVQPEGQSHPGRQ